VIFPNEYLLAEIKFVADILTGCFSYLHEQNLPEITKHQQTHNVIIYNLKLKCYNFNMFRHSLGRLQILHINYTVCSGSHCALRLWYVDLVVSIEVAVVVCCCCVTFRLYSAVKQLLKCNTDKEFNCLNQFLLTVVLSIEESVFLVEHVFREGNI